VTRALHLVVLLLLLHRLLGLLHRLLHTHVRLDDLVLRSRLLDGDLAYLGHGDLACALLSDVLSICDLFLMWLLDGHVVWFLLLHSPVLGHLVWDLLLALLLLILRHLIGHILVCGVGHQLVLDHLEWNLDIVRLGLELLHLVRLLNLVLLVAHLLHGLVVGNVLVLCNRYFDFILLLLVNSVLLVLVHGVLLLDRLFRSHLMALLLVLHGRRSSRPRLRPARYGEDRDKEGKEDQRAVHGNFPSCFLFNLFESFRL
jgi:hypothetical protein